MDRTAHAKFCADVMADIEKALERHGLTLEPWARGRIEDEIENVIFFCARPKQSQKTGPASD